MRRLAAMVLAALLLSSCAWAQVGFDAANTRQNWVEHLFANAIDVDDVATLAEAWSVPVVAESDGYSVSAPVVGGARAFVTSVGEPGHLHALAVADGAELWTATLGDAPSVAEPPALWGSMVIASSLRGVAAFDAAGVENCSGVAPDRVCEPLWSTTQLQVGATLHDFLGTSTPTVAKDVVFVTTTGVFTVALRASDGAQLWVGAVLFGPQPSPVFGAPAVAHGKVFVNSDQPPRLVGFDVTGQAPCEEDAGAVLCQPSWAGNLGVGSAVTQAGPSIANQRVLHPGGDVYDATGVQGCGGGPTVFCSPLWVVDVSAPAHVLSGQALAGVRHFVSRPTAGADNDRVFELSSTGTTECGGVPKACASVREYLLGADLPSDELSLPTVANDVLFIGTIDGIRAFDANGVAGCAATLPKPTCQPVWQLSTSGSPAPMSVFAGTLFASFDGALHAYRIPPA